jgi:thiamine biosynthesis protein ThiS
MLVNGEKISLDSAQTLGAFLEFRGFNPARVAVEKNGEIVPKTAFAREILADSDRLEIVHFVGGG